MMHKQKIQLFVIILCGGIFVLGSYAWGIAAVSNADQILWGGVPDSMRMLSSAGMVPGALGFFAYTYFILFCLNPDDTKIFQKHGYGLFIALYVAILLTSALWMPLAFLAVNDTGTYMDWLVRLDLIVVGLASLILLLSLLNTQPRQPLWAYRLSVIGCIFFCLQTVLMDAILWGIYF